MPSEKLLWKVRIQHIDQIGFDIGRPEWQDQEEILRLLEGRLPVTTSTID
jgi:hypothetical protein